LAGIALLLIIGFSVRGICGADREKEQPYEIRQGGYVEKVDPNVDYKDRLPRIPPKKPAESLKAFHVLPGFRIELVAAEPLVRDPVDVVFDADGRLYVAEMIPYAEGSTSKFGSPRGRVSLLEDTDGDGKFDKSIVFVDQLVWPTAVSCFDGGVFVVAAPDVLYCKDTDGDDKADLREVVITGFELSNPNALPNSLRWGWDNRIHGMTSTAGGNLKAVKWERDGQKRKAKPLQARGRDFSIHPRTGQLRLESGGAQFGMTFDQWGRKFECSNSSPIEIVMYEDRYIARNPFLVPPSPRVGIWTHGMTVYRTSPVEPWRSVRTEMRVGGTFSGPVEGGGKPAGYFTAACGVFIYAGDAWPKQYCGNAFVCEGAGNLIHRMRLEPAGVGFTAHRTEAKREFLTSDEIWFRPIQFCSAPDGTLYLADMYREVFEHPDAVPPSVKKYLDLTSGTDRGRIYRIVPRGFTYPGSPRLSKASTEELVHLLQHPNRWHRETAGRLLYERQDRRAIEPLVTLASTSTSPLGRVHAMYALDGLGALGSGVVLSRLEDDHPRVREHAVRLAERVLGNSPAVRTRLYAMAHDQDVRVRYQLAFTLGEIPGTQATAALSAIAVHDAGDRWIRLALLSSSLGRAGELFSQLASDPRWRNSNSGRALLQELAYQVGRQNRGDQVAELLDSLGNFTKDERGLAQAVVAGLSRGLAQAGSPLRERLGSAGSGLAKQLLAEMIASARTKASDSQQPVEKRVEAVRCLALASLAEVESVLGELLDTRQPQQVQRATLQTLGRFQDAKVATMIVNGWRGFSPQVRGEAAEALFARPERLLVLLGAIEKTAIRPSQLDPVRIRLLLSHPDEQIRREASRLLDSAKLAPREKVVAAWRDVLKMKGEAARGKAVFKRDCSKCHRLEGVGVDLGLPLAAIGNRGPETILLHVLDPNREVNPAYLNYVVLTDDGRSVSGMIVSETATSITLKRAEGATDIVQRVNIDELENTGVSIMPEGQEKLITKQEMADLIAYLMALR